MFDDAKPSQVKRTLIVRTIKNLIIHQVDGLWLPSDDYDESFIKLYRTTILLVLCLRLIQFRLLYHNHKENRLVLILTLGDLYAIQ